MFSISTHYAAVYVRHELLRHDCVRKSTFANWPNRDVDFRPLVSAGFYYAQKNDEVVCFSCGIKISGWTKDSHAYFLHRATAPTCKFLNGYDISINRLPVISHLSTVGLPMITSSNFRIDVATIPLLVGCSLNRPPIDVKCGAEIYRKNYQELSASYKMMIKIPESSNPNIILDIDGFFVMMREEKQRLNTFMVCQWPHEKPSPLDLARAGFFYCLLNDTVQCAYCRSCLGGWDEQSIPASVHKMFFPYCDFVKQFLQDVQPSRAGGTQLLNGRPQAIPDKASIFGSTKPLESTSSSSSANDESETAKLLDNLQQRLICKVCFEREVSVRFNCKHIVTCEICSMRVHSCPICRARIFRRFDVILS